MLSKRELKFGFMQKSIVKEQILSQLLDTYANALRVFKQTTNRNQLHSSALFLPPDDPGSLGDEAMLAAGMKHLADRDIKHMGIINLKSSVCWENLNLVTETINLRGHFAYHSWKDRFRFVRIVSRYDRFYCIGADVMDGFYSDSRTLRFIELVGLAAKTGAKATILGFSFNKQPTPTSVQALVDLPTSVRLCCRDPISHQRLIHHLQRPVDLVADVAFLLEPAQESELAMGVSKWIRQQQDLGRKVVGVNANSLHLKSLPQFGFDDLTKLYADALIELSSSHPEISFLMIPHDVRGKESDDSLAKAILGTLPISINPYSTRVPTPCSAAEIKSICADLDLVFTGRMHLAIACLGQGVPVAGVTYQGKFEGLFNHFALQGMTIAPEQAFQPGALASFLAEIITKRKEIRKQIQSRLEDVKALAALNLMDRGNSG